VKRKGKKKNSAVSSKKRPSKRQTELEAMRNIATDELRDQIRRLLALPMNQRTHFLRARLPGGGSAL
jgi:hypothetical protein